MGSAVVVVLGLIALGAAAISSVTGVAGGLLLLSGLLLVLPAAAVVPLHGAVQTVACATRVAAFRSHIRWDIVWRFSIPILPGSLLGIALVWWLVTIDASFIKLLIAGAILLSLFSKKLRFSSESAKSLRLFYGLGLSVGFFGVLAGSTGPIVSQALLLFDVKKEEHIATKSTVQGIAHLLKLPLFGLALGFDFGPWMVPLAVMSVAASIGTMMGKRLLGRMSPERFVVIARALLALCVLQIAATELYALVA